MMGTDRVTGLPATIYTPPEDIVRTSDDALAELRTRLTRGQRFYAYVYIGREWQSLTFRSDEAADDWMTVMVAAGYRASRSAPAL